MQYKKLISVILIIGLGTSFVPHTVLATYSQPLSISFLKSQTIDDWSVMALAANEALSDINTDFLKTDPGNTPTNIEKRILSMVAAGKNPETFGQINLIDKLTSKFNGTEITTPVATGLLNDDIFGLLAFSASGTHLEIQNKLAGFIKSNQNADGGWSFTHSPSVSDSNMTAMAIMALVSAGENKNSETITRAFNYLEQTKSGNGYSYDATSGFGADGSSTAWVISSFLATGKTIPAESVSYLQSLQKTNGSFSWVQSDQSGNLLTTAYASIALNQRFYPIKSVTIPPAVTQFAVIHNTRIIFNAPVVLSTNTVLGALDSASKQGGFVYTTTNTSLGLYVSSIDGINPEGTRGWMYAVNGVKPASNAENYLLKNNDQIIWYYGSPHDPIPALPASAHPQVSLATNILPPEQMAPPNVILTSSKTHIKLGENITISWQTSRGTKVLSSTPNAWAGNSLSGEITLQPIQNTTYTLIVEGLGGITQNSIIINVDQTPSIVFGINTSHTDFGDLRPGEESPNHLITLKNQGSKKLQITASLSLADSVYEQGLQMNNTLWNNYKTSLTANSSENINLKLKVPQIYNSTGTKTGILIFWASPHD